MNGESIFTIKATAKSVTITQVQTLRKRLPARTKKNQTGAVDLQLNPRKRSNAPLKTKQQAAQTQLRNNGSESRGQKNASSAPATDAQRKIVAPTTLSKEEEEGADDAPRRPPREERGVRLSRPRRTRPQPVIPAPRLGPMRGGGRRRRRRARCAKDEY